jgi:3-oxoacyl-[acyl-carrier protein] reductase
MSLHTERQVIVTGGGTGIGRAIAQRFAADSAHITLLGRRQPVLEQTAKDLQNQFPDAVINWQACDVSSVEEVQAFERWLQQTIDAPIDVLVNNAGGVDATPDDAPLAELAASAQRLLASNLLGTYLVTQALRPRLRRPGGRIINISSIAAVRGGGGMYSAAKAGVIGLTYALAGELGAEGITVNAVAPGLTLDTEFFGDRLTEARLQRTVAQIPMGRPGRPADIAAAVHYLASEEASYVTGQVHHVNGGWVFGR